MSRAWVVLAFGLGLGSWLFSAWPVASHRWDWEPAVAASQPWRAFTAAWVHWSPDHLAMNIVACAIVAALGWAGGLPRSAALAWLLAWPMTAWMPSAVGHLWPLVAAEHIGGLSGALHAGVAVAAVWLGVRGRGWERGLGLLLGLGLAAKHLWEWQVGPQLLAGSAVQVSAASHLGGSLSGILAATFMLVTSRTRVHQMRGGVVEGGAMPTPAPHSPQTHNPTP